MLYFFVQLFYNAAGGVGKQEGEYGMYRATEHGHAQFIYYRAGKQEMTCIRKSYLAGMFGKCIFHTSIFST